MTPNETRTLWISVGFAIFAVFLMYSYSQEKKAEYDRRFGTSKRVVVAKEDISEMQTIDDTMLDIIERPVDFIEPGALNDPELIIGQVAATPIRKGEQLTQTQLLAPGPFTGISLQVSPGKRAVSLPADELHSVSRLIKPGDRVDILAALDYGKGGNQRREVKTIMQDVVVLSTGLRVVNNIPRIHEKESGDKLSILNFKGDHLYTNLSVEVDPKQAQDLVFILSTSPGSLFLTLRNPNDRLLKTMPVSTVDDVLGKVQPVAPIIRAPASLPPPPPPPKPKKKGPFVPL